MTAVIAFPILNQNSAPNLLNRLTAAPAAEERLDTETASALLAGQARVLEVPPGGIRQAELARGIALDTRVDSEQMDAISAHYLSAQLRFLDNLSDRSLGSREPVLFAPTSRTIDHVIPSHSLGALVRALIAERKLPELLAAIDSGPTDGSVTWDRPASPVQLVASMIRWGCLREGDKKRLRPADDIRAWVGETIADAGIPMQSRLGGVSAVGAALAGALGHIPTMISLGKLPPDLEGHLSPELRVVSDTPNVSTLKDIPREARPNGHYCLACGVVESLALPDELASFRVNGQLFNREDIRRLDMLITGSTQVQGFGTLTRADSARLGYEHPLVVLSGAQALPDSEASRTFFEHVEAMHQAGASIALLYSESKFPHHEVEMWRELRRSQSVDFIGMNTAESFDVLARIAESVSHGNPLELSQSTLDRINTALKIGRLDHTIPWENGRESPRWIFQAALLVQEVLDVPVVRIRGKCSDTTIVGKDVAVTDPEAVRDHLVLSRHFGVLKVASPGGLLTDRSHFALLLNSPHGTHLAAMHEVSDEIAKCWNSAVGTIEGQNPHQLTHRCYDPLPDGRLCFAIPPLPFFERRGGTQSAGDTIDVTFATEEASGLFKDARLSRLLSSRVDA